MQRVVCFESSLGVEICDVISAQRSAPFYKGKLNYFYLG